MPVKNKVQLITYADSLGGDLKTLNSVLLKYFPDICSGGVHILPPFPSSGDSKSAKKVVDVCIERGGTLSRILTDEYKDKDGFDVHQIQCSYYSALNCDDDAYLAARAIQFFTPGIPQVYYVGLLAGENDAHRAKITGERREINRHNFSLEEIEQSLQKKVVQRLLKLIRFRNEYDAFNGDFEIMTCPKDEVRLVWSKGIKKCSLFIDLKTNKTVINYIDDNGNNVQYLV